MSDMTTPSRILVVDDDQAIAEMVGIVLRGKGYERIREGRPFQSWSEVEPYVNSVPGWMLEGQERFLFEKARSLPDGAVILDADRAVRTRATFGLPSSTPAGLHRSPSPCASCLPTVRPRANTS